MLESSSSRMDDTHKSIRWGSLEEHRSCGAFPEQSDTGHAHISRELVSRRTCHRRDGAAAEVLVTAYSSVSFRDVQPPRISVEAICVRCLRSKRLRECGRTMCSKHVQGLPPCRNRVSL